MVLMKSLMNNIITKKCACCHLDSVTELGICEDCLKKDEKAWKALSIGDEYVKEIIKEIHSKYKIGQFKKVLNITLKLKDKGFHTLASNIAESCSHLIKIKIQVFTLAEVKHGFNHDLKVKFRWLRPKDDDLFIVAMTPNPKIAKNGVEAWKSAWGLTRRIWDYDEEISFVPHNYLKELWDVLLKYHQGWMILEDDVFHLSADDYDKYIEIMNASTPKGSMDEECFIESDDDKSHEMIAQTLLEKENVLESPKKKRMSFKEGREYILELPPNSDKPKPESAYYWIIFQITNINNIDKNYNRDDADILKENQPHWGIKEYTLEEEEDATKGLRDRDGWLSYRKRIPKQHCKKFGKPEFQFSLNTRKRKEAVILCNEINKIIKKLFLQASSTDEVIKLIDLDALKLKIHKMPRSVVLVLEEPPEEEPEEVHDKDGITRRSCMSLKIELGRVEVGECRPCLKTPLGNAWKRYCVKRGKYSVKNGRHKNGKHYDAELTKIIWKDHPEWFDGVYCEFRPEFVEEEAVIEESVIEEPVVFDKEPVIEEVVIEEAEESIAKPEVEMEVSQFSIIDKKILESKLSEMEDGLVNKIVKIIEEKPKPKNKGLFSRFWSSIVAGCREWCKGV